jgi:hypothetical protein
MQYRVRFLLLLASLWVLNACAVPSRAPVDSFESLGNDETLVVGRIELVPPLRQGEQKTDELNASNVENRVFLIATEQPQGSAGNTGTADNRAQIETILGKNFFVRSKDHPFYILGGVMYLDMDNRGMSQAYFPGGLKVGVKPGDKAVYVGTIRYHRNESWEITKVAIVDDYDSANAEFQKKFGARYALRKAFVTPIRQ